MSVTLARGPFHREANRGGKCWKIHEFTKRIKFRPERYLPCFDKQAENSTEKISRVRAPSSGTSFPPFSPVQHPLHVWIEHKWKLVTGGWQSPSDQTRGHPLRAIPERGHFVVLRVEVALGARVTVFFPFLRFV